MVFFTVGTGVVTVVPQDSRSQTWRSRARSVGENILEKWRGIFKSSMTGSKKQASWHDMIYFFTISYVDDLFGCLFDFFKVMLCGRAVVDDLFFPPLVLKNSFLTAHTRRTPGDVSDHNHHFQDHQCPWWRDDCDHWCLWGWLGWLGRMGWI